MPYDDDEVEEPAWKKLPVRYFINEKMGMSWRSRLDQRNTYTETREVTFQEWREYRAAQDARHGVQYLIYFDPQRKAKLHAEAKRRGVKPADLARRVMEWWLDQI